MTRWTRKNIKDLLAEYFWGKFCGNFEWKIFGGGKYFVGGNIWWGKKFGGGKIWWGKMN